MSFSRTLQTKTWIKIIVGIVFAGIVLILFLERFEGDDEWNTLVAEPVEPLEIQLPIDEEIPVPLNLTIEIAGEVHHPYVYEVPIGSRVIDGIDAAGGLTESADTRNTNLAALLVDGMKVYIPSKEEVNAVEVKTGIKAGTSYVGGNTSLNTEATQEESSKVNINTADLTRLQTLNGVGPATAEKIITYRTDKGPYKTIADIKKVSGIGDKTFEKLKDHITVE
ncbi:MAG: comEA protein [Firmicutes bacterium HGW-Firmicutes-11]|jgi:competence protein ComEA|nr:MAG: comEA protein [Firmicutes bacterium HGW-Firmicutes-11]